MFTTTPFLFLSLEYFDRARIELPLEFIGGQANNAKAVPDANSMSFVSDLATILWKNDFLHAVAIEGTDEVEGLSDGYDFQS